jgi:hypothetical protein
MGMLDAVLAALDKMGLEYLILEFGGILLLLYMAWTIRKMVKLQKINLRNLDKYYAKVSEKIGNHHEGVIKLINVNQDEIDPAHLYSKINKFEDDLSRHQHEEVRLLHDVSKTVSKMEVRLEDACLKKGNKE